jgi:phosphatidylglycerophosphatase A
MSAEDNMDKHDRSYLKNLSLKNPWHFIALGMGSGLCPKAPGTMGSLVVVPLCMLLLYLPDYITMMLCVLTLLVGTYAASVTEKDMGMHDNSAIVIDEFLGMFISVLFFPPLWYLALLAFVLFRVFDILKPFPIGYIDKRVKGGLGVMLDDVLAGLYALLAGHLIIRFVGLA